MRPQSVSYVVKGATFSRILFQQMLSFMTARTFPSLAAAERLKLMSRANHNVFVYPR